MNEITFNNWHILSDQALLKQIGDFVKHNRVRLNKSQDELSKEAGLSRSTVSLLERGETVTLSTLIQVLRVLDQLQVMDAFKVQEQISPLALAKAERDQPKRVSKKRRGNEKHVNW